MNTNTTYPAKTGDPGQFMGKSLFTLAEACNYLGLSRSAMYKLTSGKAIPHYKPTGKIIYFDRTELEEWAKQNRICPMQEINDRAQRFCSIHKI